MLSPLPAAIEAEVERAAESALGADAPCVEGFTHGNINRVFEVVAGGRAFVLKVSTFPGWPEPGKLTSVESRRRARGSFTARGADFSPHPCP